MMRREGGFFNLSPKIFGQFSLAENYFMHSCTVVSAPSPIRPRFIIIVERIFFPLQALIHFFFIFISMLCNNLKISFSRIKAKESCVLRILIKERDLNDLPFSVINSNLSRLDFFFKKSLQNSVIRNSINIGDFFPFLRFQIIKKNFTIFFHVCTVC